jgi:hypothetical protein
MPDTVLAVWIILYFVITPKCLSSSHKLQYDTMQRDIKWIIWAAKVPCGVKTRCLN